MVVVDRFWFPRGEPINVDEAGFLLDPEHDFLRHSNPSAARLPTLREYGCLVLLGEAGLGKSTDLSAESGAVAALGVPVVSVDLGQVGGDDALVRQVFGGPGWDAWRAGATLTVYLDAFDECRGSLRNVAQILLRELRGLIARERLRLRIACRPGTWPQLLEEGLRQLWQGSVGVYHLAPLRHRDAEAIAAASGVPEAAAFLDAVRRTDVGPLAASPLTLQLLARIQRERSALPSRRREVYEQGCLALCTEHNLSRRAAGLLGSLSPPQRLAVAGRLAALTLLCGKVGVWLGPETARPSSEWLTVAEATGGSEQANDLPFTVTEAAVREVLQDTALFGAAAPDRLMWIHRSYAEFQAARYLLEHQVPTQQLRNLLWHPVSQDRIVPQLIAVVGWLVPRGDLLRLVRQTDAQALFAMDLGECDEDKRARVVEAVLQAAEAGRFSEQSIGAVQYRRLAHIGLADQLRRVISDKGRPAQVRELAVDMGRTCCVAQLQDDLVRVALDDEDVLDIRYLAASTVNRLEDRSVRARLRPLLDRDLAEDVTDDLRGYVLRATWPHSLTSPEVFARLTPPKSPSYVGAYWEFLHDHLLPGLQDADLPIALKWVAGLEQELSRRTLFRKLCDRILLRAWNCGNFAAVAPDLASAVYARIQRHERGLGEDDADGFGSDDNRRHQLLAVLLPLVPGEWVQARKLLAFRPRLVRESDLPWLFQQLDAAQHASLRHTLSEVLMGLFDPSDEARLALFLDAGRRHSELQARLDPHVAPVELGSPLAQRMRLAYEQEQAEQHEAAEEDADRPLDPPPRERVLRCLERAEGGQYDAWAVLTLELTLTPTSRAYGSWLASDLTATPGWEDADEATRRRLLAAAEAFLRQGSPRLEDWLDRDRRPGEHAIAGFKALRLLRKEAAAAFDAMELPVWDRWLIAVLAYPSAGDDDNERAQEELVAHAYRTCPDKLLDCLRSCVLRENQQVDVVVELLEGGGRVERREEVPSRVIWRVESCWDGQIAALVRSLLHDPDINATVHCNLLAALLRHQDGDALLDARSVLAAGLPSEDKPRRRFRLMTLTLLDHAPAAVWPFIRDWERTHPDFCRSVLEGFADLSPSRAVTTLGDRLSEQELAEAYRMVRALFPPQPPPADGSFQAETPAERMGHFASDLMRHLCERDTFATLAAIDAIAPAFPPGDLRYARIEAECRALENTWQAPTPAQLLGIVGDSRRRLVRSGEELLLVLRESLDRFEAELQGETALAFTLWDERATNVFRPKEEERFADVIKQHLVQDLRDRGIIAHREVEIRTRQGTGGSAGERTDIHVDVVEPHPVEGRPARIRAIIEVKGCWHREVLTAMETQLRDRYLRDNDCSHGLYVVGWFLCPQWDSDRADGRRADARRLMPMRIAEARATFEAQARDLSTDGVTLAAAVINTSLR